MNDRRSSWLLAAIVALVVLPTLAAAPQSGDAAEQIMTALHGGVMHPPGFPVQAWLSRLFIALPFGAPAWRLALMSWFGLAMLAFFVADSLRLLGVSMGGRLLAVFALALHSSVWFFGVRPEMYSLAHTFIALLLWQAVRLADGNERNRDREAALLGAAVALAATVHPITVVALPAIGVAAWQLLKSAPGRPRRFVIMAATFAVLFAGLYASLPLLRRGAAWPDWGGPELVSVSGLVRHILRLDYGVFEFAAASGERPSFGLVVFLKDLQRNWAALLLLVIPGIVTLRTRLVDRNGRTILLAIAGTAVLALLVVLRAKAFGRGGEAFLAKLEGATLIPAALLLGLGVDELWRRLASIFPGGSLRTGWLTAGAVAFGVLLATQNWSVADASGRRTVDLFRYGIAMELPSDALFLSRSDVESFYGVPWQGKTNGVRFPVEVGLVETAWYAKHVMPRIDPRLASVGPKEASELIDLSLRSGRPVASTDYALLRRADRPAELRGLVVVLHPAVTGLYSKRTLEAAGRLCPVVAELGALSTEPDAIEINLYAHFARAYLGAKEYLTQVGDRATADVAEQIRVPLLDGTRRHVWRESCKQFEERIARNYLPGAAAR